jgi:hypothetical protein
MITECDEGINILMSVIHLYRIQQVVELTTASTGASLMNYPVNRTDFNLARHVDNEVEFWVKNIDRKPVPLGTARVTMHISEVKTGKVLLTRDLIVLDAAKGLVRLFVSGDETAIMPKGFLKYSIVMTRADGVQVMLYTDRDRKGVGHVEVIDGPLPDPIDAIPLSLSNFISLGHYDGNTKLYSTALPGAAMVHNVSGQHSAVLHLKEFSGSVTVQGTLEVQPSAISSNWFDVITRTFVDETSVLHMPFEGNLMHVRFVVQQDSGTIDPILYRN